ncbi:MAG TPA: cysteine hydrolase [Candidatus Binatia bacterium]|jgi:nicotinamidase-related amidase|nr:cysteine hydrolase [Candidatus Binatia bacterium]
MKAAQTIFRSASNFAGTLTLVLLTASPALAADIIAEWATVKAPPVPELKPVTLDGKTTALLILDMMKRGCSARPRCVATVPNVKKLHDAARASGAMVFYSLVGGDNPTPADIVDSGIAPRDGEWVFQRGPDKYLGSGLDERLKARGIKTVIVCGTSAQGVVIGTGSGSAQRGYKVIVPVDCMSSEDPYMEQYAAWHMFKGGPAIVTEQTTLTRSDMIKF